jgi:hypothetical protein
MRVAAVLAATCLLLAPNAARAEEARPISTFGDLAGLCARTSDAAAQAFCQGYIMGSGELYLALRRAEVIDRWACADPIPTLDEISRAIVAWAAANPQHASERAVDGLWRAAAAIYPCS